MLNNPVVVQAVCAEAITFHWISFSRAEEVRSFAVGEKK